MFGSRAIYHDGWKAVTFKPIGPLYDDGLNWNAPFSEDRWELYHVAEDPTELHDLAEAEPGRLADMVERWWVEARRNQVLPLDNRILHTLVNPKPDRRTPRLATTYYPGTSPVPETVAANMKNRGHVIEVDVTVPEGPPAEGVLLAQGSALGGFSLHLWEGRPRYLHNLYGKELYALVGDRPLEPGRHRVVFRFDRQGRAGGPAELEVDGLLVAEAQLPLFTVAAFSATGAGLTCGYEFGPSVGEDYRAPVPLHGHHPCRHRDPGRARPDQPHGRVRAHHGRAVAASRASSTMSADTTVGPSGLTNGLRTVVVEGGRQIPRPAA